MKSAKNEVIDLLHDLPEDVSYDQIQYRIYVQRKIERGLQDVAQNRTLSQDQVKQRLAKWINIPSNGRI